MKSDQSNQTKPSSKDSEIEEVNHLDNDKELDEILETLQYAVLNSQVSEKEFKTQVWYKFTDEFKARIDQYTQSKLKAFAGEFEKAIGEEIMCYDSTDISHKFMSCDTCQSNMKNYELRQALKAIKEKAGIE